MDFLEHMEIEKKQLDESYKQSLKNKQERYLGVLCQTNEN
jgi:hypothetical protein